MVGEFIRSRVMTHDATGLTFKSRIMPIRHFLFNSFKPIDKILKHVLTEITCRQHYVTRLICCRKQCEDKRTLLISVLSFSNDAFLKLSLTGIFKVGFVKLRVTTNKLEM